MKQAASCIGLLFGSLLGLSVDASELIYKHVNPSFGGNALNSAHLLGTANAQDTYKDPDARSRSSYQRSALDRFTSSLEARLLSQLLTDISDGNTGSLDTDDFIINIIDDAGILSIEITDKNTGELTEIEVNGLASDNP